MLGYAAVRVAARRSAALRGGDDTAANKVDPPADCGSELHRHPRIELRKLREPGPSILRFIVRRYEGTRLGRQELDGEVLEDVEGALWYRDQLEQCRRERAPVEFVRVVVAIDPAATSGEDADETGIVVAGKDVAGHAYVITDISGHYAPTEWARIAIAAYREHHADRIVAEVNNGGEMVEATLRVVDPNVSYSAVRATRGKITRAEPVSALYEQGRVPPPRRVPAA